MDWSISRNPSLTYINMWYWEWSTDVSRTFQNHIFLEYITLKSHIDIYISNICFMVSDWGLLIILGHDRQYGLGYQQEPIFNIYQYVVLGMVYRCFPHILESLWNGQQILQVTYRHTHTHQKFALQVWDWGYLLILDHNRQYELGISKKQSLLYINEWYLKWSTDVSRTL